jgi:hypothetical protein
MMTEFFL